MMNCLSRLSLSGARRAKMIVALFFAFSLSTYCATVNADIAADTDNQSKSSKHKHKKSDDQQVTDAAPLSTSDRNSAPCLSWTSPMVAPRCCLLCIHGLGLYSGAYANFGQRMARHGIATYAIDVRGFGSWMKAEGHEEVDFKDCLDDVHVALQAIHNAHPGLPVFLLGESMGGAIALRATAMYPELVDGLISSVPAGDRFKQKKTDLKVALEYLTGPNKQHDIGTSIVKQATQDEKLRQDWQDDPLDRMNLSAHELIQFQKFMNENHDAAKDITKTPVLFVQGSHDKLVKPEGTWDLFNEQATDQKTFLAVPSEHLIFEEAQDQSHSFDEKVTQLVTAWIFAHIPSGGGTIVSESENRQLMRAIDKIVAGKYSAAQTDLQNIIATDPGDEKAHYYLGVTYMKMGKPQQAKPEFATAMTLGRGTDPARNANNYLLALSQELKSGAGKQPNLVNNASRAQLPVSVFRSLATGGKPVVLAFYAPWAEECDSLDALFTKARNLFSNQVVLVKVNVDDHQNDQLVRYCAVGPIPTFVYLTNDGHIASTSIGKSNFVEFARGVAATVH